MKLSKETIKVLQNFHTINTAIILREGNVIMTQKNDVIVARAEVPDTFPRTIPIIDLSKFLALLSLGKEDADADFGDDCITITQGGYTVKYAYAPENLIVAPPAGQNIKLPSKDVQFTLNEETWQQVSKAMQIMSFSEFAFVGEDGKLSIQALSMKIQNGGSDTYSAHIGDTDKEFRCVLSAANMKLIPGDYDVTISKSGLVNFKGEVAEYWITMSTKSQFDD